MVSAEMKATSTSFDAGNSSTQEMASRSKELSTALDTQKTALMGLKTQLAAMQFMKSLTT